MTAEVLEFTSGVTDNLLQVAQSFCADANYREEAQKNGALAREQCQRQQAERFHQQAEEKEKNLKTRGFRARTDVVVGYGSPRGEASKGSPRPMIKAFAREESRDKLPVLDHFRFRSRDRRHFV